MGKYNFTQQAPVLQGLFNKVQNPDSEPTENSDELVTSGGVYDAIKDAEDAAKEVALASFATDTASGSIASFPDGAESVPIKSMAVQIEPVQDLHGYSNPWPAGGHFNQLNEDDFIAGWLNYQTGVWDASYPTRKATQEYQPCQPSTSYYFGAFDSSGVVQTGSGFELLVCWYDSNKDFISGRNQNVSDYVYTSPANAAYFRLAKLTNAYTAAVNYPSTEHDYSPYSNICPISGYTGANVYVTGINVWDEETELGGINASTGANNSLNDRLRSSYIPVKPSTSYFINTSQWSGAYCYDKDKTFIGAATYVSSGTGWVLTTLAGSAFVRVAFAAAYGTTYNNDISINYPSTDTSYHAYLGTTYPTTFSDTIYGGLYTPTEEENNCTENRVFLIFDGSDDEGWYKLTVNPAETSRFLTKVGELGVYKQDLEDDLHSLFNLWDTQVILSTNQIVGARVYDSTSLTPQGAYILVRPVGAGDMTLAEFKAILTANPLQACLELVTPTTTTETSHDISTKYGENNIFADCGDCSVVYRADTKLYIDKKLGA